MRIALYARVSTLHQAQSQTIDQQLTRLHAYATEHGWVVPDEHIFRDDGRSGATLNGHPVTNAGRPPDQPGY